MRECLHDGGRGGDGEASLFGGRRHVEGGRLNDMLDGMQTKKIESRWWFKI